MGKLFVVLLQMEAETYQELVDILTQHIVPTLMVVYVHIESRYGTLTLTYNCAEWNFIFRSNVN